MGKQILTILSLMLFAVLTFSLVGCDSNKHKNDDATRIYEQLKAAQSEGAESANRFYSAVMWSFPLLKDGKYSIEEIRTISNENIENNRYKASVSIVLVDDNNCKWSTVYSFEYTQNDETKENVNIDESTEEYSELEKIEADE